MEHAQLLEVTEAQAEQHTNSFRVVMTEQIWLSLSSTNRFMWEGKKIRLILFCSIFSTGNGFQAENQKKTMTALENVLKLLQYSSKMQVLPAEEGLIKT